MPRLANRYTAAAARPVVAAQIAEGNVEGPRDPGPCRDVHLALGELGTRRIDVRDDQVQAWTEPSGVPTIPVLNCDRAGKSLQPSKRLEPRIRTPPQKLDHADIESNMKPTTSTAKPAKPITAHP